MLRFLSRWLIVSQRPRSQIRVQNESPHPDHGRLIYFHPRRESQVSVPLCAACQARPGPALTGKRWMDASVKPSSGLHGLEPRGLIRPQMWLACSEGDAVLAGSESVLGAGAALSEVVGGQATSKWKGSGFILRLGRSPIHQTKSEGWAQSLFSGNSKSEWGTETAQVFFFFSSLSQNMKVKNAVMSQC